MFDCLTPLIPSSSRTRVADSPFSSNCPRPLIKACTASIGCDSQALAKSAADILATAAICSKLSVDPAEKPATADSMAVKVCVIAVPPASASIPTELMAVERAKISVDVIPASVPADASLVDIATMEASSVAKLLPRSTIAAPSLSTFPVDSPVIFKNLARDVAASSAERFVVSPSSTMTFVNSNRFSFAIPN